MKPIRILSMKHPDTNTMLAALQESLNTIFVPREDFKLQQLIVIPTFNAIANAPEALGIVVMEAQTEEAAREYDDFSKAVPIYNIRDNG